MGENKSLISKREISRRDALKALAAASGAVMASGMLPDAWSSPVVQGGVLPAHAQSTNCFEQVKFAVNECSDSTCPPGVLFGIEVYYSPKNLIPSHVENIKIDCQCLDIKTTLNFIEPGHFYLWYEVNDPQNPCICEFRSTVYFRGGCAIIFNIILSTNQTSRPARIEVKRL